MKRCRHSYVDLKDGSCDKLCILCGNKFKQAFLALPTSNEMGLSEALPISSSSSNVIICGMPFEASKEKIKKDIYEALRIPSRFINK